MALITLPVLDERLFGQSFFLDLNPVPIASHHGSYWGKESCRPLKCLVPPQPTAYSLQPTALFSTYLMYLSTIRIRALPDRRIRRNGQFLI